MATVNFYTPLQQALMGANPKIKRTRGSVINPAAGGWGAAADITEKFLDAFEKRRERKDRSDIIAALTGSEIAPFEFDETKKSDEEKFAIDAAQKAQQQLNNKMGPFREGSEPSVLQGNIDEMTAALTADMREPNIKAQEKAFRENLNTPEAVQARMAALDPRVKRNPLFQSLQISKLEREQALKDAAIERDRAADLLKDTRKHELQLKGIGPPVAPKVSIKPVRNLDSSTGWSFANVLDPNSPFLGEAQGQAARFDPNAAAKVKKADLTSERYTEATEGLGEVDNMLTNIEQMRGLAKSTDTGALTQTKTSMKKLANVLGMNFDETKIANVEAMRTVGMKFILDIISKTKGAISEKEMKLFEAASPGAGITPLGNKQILDLAEATAERLKVAHQAVRNAYRDDTSDRVDLDDAFLKSKEEWGGFGFIFPPKNLTPQEKEGWSNFTWQDKKEWYDLNELSY